MEALAKSSGHITSGVTLASLVALLSWGRGILTDEIKLHAPDKKEFQAMQMDIRDIKNELRRCRRRWPDETTSASQIAKE